MCIYSATRLPRAAAGDDGRGGVGRSGGRGQSHLLQADAQPLLRQLPLACLPCAADDAVRGAYIHHRPRPWQRHVAVSDRSSRATWHSPTQPPFKNSSLMSCMRVLGRGSVITTWLCSQRAAFLSVGLSLSREHSTHSYRSCSSLASGGSHDTKRGARRRGRERGETREGIRRFF
jgi:hypothetical protein